MIDLATLTDAVFRRVASDAEGASVRATLGSGGLSVMMAEDLAVLGDSPALRDVTPCMALRRQIALPVDRTDYSVSYRWYCYDDPARGFARLEALPALLAAAYEGFADGRNLTELEIQIGAQSRDRALGLLLLTVDIVISAV